MSGHFKDKQTPGACSMMMYSLPIVLEASSLQSSILGIGILVLVSTNCT